MSHDALTEDRSGDPGAAPAPETGRRRRRREAALIVGLVVVLTIVGAVTAMWQPELDCGVLGDLAEAPEDEGTVGRQPADDVLRAAVQLGADLELGALLGARSDPSITAIFGGADTLVAASPPQLQALQPGTSLLVPRPGLTLTAARPGLAANDAVVPAGNRVAAFADGTDRYVIVEGQLQINSCGTAPADAVPLATNGRILLVDAGDELVARTPDGEQAWRVALPGAVVTAGFTRDDVVVVDASGAITGLDERGEQRWRVDGPADPSVATVGERGVAVASQDRATVLDRFGEPLWSGPIDGTPQAATTIDEGALIMTGRTAYRATADGVDRVRLDDALQPVGATTLGNSRVGLLVDTPDGRAAMLFEPDD